jgi:hypothetical protein
MRMYKINKRVVILGGAFPDEEAVEAVTNTVEEIGAEYNVEFVKDKEVVAAKFYLTQNFPQQRREEIKEIIRTFRKYLGQE